MTRSELNNGHERRWFPDHTNDQATLRYLLMNQLTDLHTIAQIIGNDEQIQWRSERSDPLEGDAGPLS